MLNRATMPLIAFELVVLLLWFPHLHWTPWRAVGGALVAGSLLLILVARWQLGRAFTVRARATRLVTTGVYARVRNPIYVGSVLLFAGIPLLAERWWPAVFLLLVAPLQWRRAGREARVLEERFGEEYVRYRRRTWF